MSTILLAEDDEIMRISVSDRLQKCGYKVIEAADGYKAEQLLFTGQYDLVLSDIKMPGTSGIQLLEKIHEQHQETDVIMMTAFGSVESAIDCMKMGAADYLVKPFNLDDLIMRIQRIFDAQAVRKKCEILEADCSFLDSKELFGQSPPMQAIFSIIEQAAPTNATILITGESGTGKELAARAVHKASNRSQQPFISVNCAAIPEGLIESELFGHERGAFTGADKRRKGKFELADNGTLLLDELGDLPLGLQAKLLRALQESQFERVGGSTSIDVDVRILACTSKDLHLEVEKGRFRQDLLYRLQVIPLHMPPLRERKEDIEALCHLLLAEFNNIHGRNIVINQAAIHCLQNYDYPGNVRELRNLIERAYVLCHGPQITPDDLPAELNREVTPTPGYNLAENMNIAEKQFLQKALQKSDGKRTEAAKLLGISRKNLWEKMKNHEM